MTTHEITTHDRTARLGPPRRVRRALARLLIVGSAVAGPAVLAVPAASAASDPAPTVSALAAAGEQCGDAYDWAGGSNAAGVRLFSYDLRAHFCWDGRDVTRVDTPEHWNALTRTGLLTGWSNKSEPEPVVQRNVDGDGSVTYRVRGRSRFEGNCIAGAVTKWIPGACTQSRSMHIDLTLHGNGTFDADHGNG